jgi:hypothetical protein
MIVDEGCFERGCACHDSRESPGVVVVKQPEQEPVAWLYPEGLEALQKGKCWTVYGTKQDAQCSIPVYLNGAVAQKVEPAQAECAGFDSQPASQRKQPEQEPVPKSTWQKLYEAAIDQRNEAVAELRRLHAENVLLHERHHFDNGVLCELLQALKDATDAIELWGTYASDYFQKKWDLQSDINAARAAIAKAEGQV